MNRPALAETAEPRGARACCARSARRNATPRSQAILAGCSMPSTLSILVMVVRHVATDFHTTREAVTYAIFLTLAAAYNAPLQNRIAAAHGHDYRFALASVVACGVCEVALAAYPTLEARTAGLADASVAL